MEAEHLDTQSNKREEKQAEITSKSDGKPKLSMEYAEELAKKLSGLEIERVKELDSFYDRNYHITGQVDQGQTQVVMKIINTVESKNVSFFDGLVELLLHLRENGIKCPQPCKLTNGEYMSVETIPDSGHHIVYCLTYLDGIQLAQVEDESPAMYHSAGALLAELDIVLKDFHHEGLEAREGLNAAWKLENLLDIRSLLHIIDDKELLDVVTSVLKAFEVKVLPNYEHFQKGLIHGDYHAYNVIVKPWPEDESSKKYTISGIIDFNDVTASCYLFDIAFAISTFMLQSKTQDPDVVRNHTLSGYESKFVLSDRERALLDICIAGRLAQLSVMGFDDLKRQPDNEYLRVIVTSSITRLKAICSTAYKEKFNLV
ncbi:hydroxylysine kinase-like [Glandiceps talaboti]